MTMIPEQILIAAAVCAALLGLGALVVWRLAALPAIPNLERVRSFRVDAYRPLARLLSHGDVAFLRSLPGYTRAGERAFRRRRYSLFMSYVRAAWLDFRSVRRAALYLSMHAPAQSPDVSSELSRISMRFRIQMARLLVRGWLYAAGWDSIGDEQNHRVADALESLSTVYRQMQTLVPVPQAG